MPGCPSRARAAVVLAWSLLFAGCQIEDRTPSGTRRDDAAIQSVLSGYHRALAARDWKTASAYVWRGAIYAGVAAPADASPATPASRVMPVDSALAVLGRVAAQAPALYDVRLVRSDVRLEGDVAGAWVTTRRRLPEQGRAVEQDWLEHLVLRRVGDTWRILTIAHADRSKLSR
jgi:hypothetical protein